MTGDNYREIRAAAQAAADADGHDRGIERLNGSFRSFLLPRRENRYGHELRCEVVSCSDLRRCVPGHGPIVATRKRRVHVDASGSIRFDGRVVGGVQAMPLGGWAYRYNGYVIPAPSRARAILACISAYCSWVGLRRGEGWTRG